MSVIPAGFGSSGSYEIANSLRLRKSASASLSRTPAGAGNRKLLAYRFRVKRGELGTLQVIASAGTASIDRFYFDTSNRLCLDVLGVARLVTTQVFRDPSAWAVDVGFELDVANGTAASRAKILVDGVEVSSYSTDGRASIANTDTNWHNTVVHYLGRDNSGNYFDGYLAEPIGVDGSIIVNSYSTTNADNVQVPVQPSATYGTNGFYLDFSDGTSTTTLGYDAAGSNDWTLVNFSLTAGVTYDWMEDTPTNNYCVLSPLHNLTSFNASAPTSGNLNAAASTSSNDVKLGTIAFLASSKIYWEHVYLTMPAGTTPHVGVRNHSGNSIGSVYTAYRHDGLAFSNNTGTWSAFGASYTAGDVIGIAWDTSTGNVEFFKNGASQGTVANSSLAGTTLFPYVYNASFGSSVFSTSATNFGQRPFIHTPPTGFVALSTANLPAVTVRDPSAQFDVALDTGANIKTTAEALFTDQLAWIKDRANANNHQLIDSVRGTTAVLQSNTTAAETTYSTPSGNSVGWVWKANGTGAANTDGLTSSTVAANTTSGFSIVTYTGTGANATVGHGLGAAPKMIVVKDRTAASTNDWAVYHASVAADAQTDYLLLNSTAAVADDATYWNDTAPTSSVFSIGTNADVNTSTNTYVAYCFAEVPGFSKIGSYTGNGNADGPFAYCGFRPAFVLVKMSSSTGNWTILDAEREGYNVDNDPLYPNLTNAEGTTDLIDIVSNGFKIRSADASVNTNTGTYIFLAFAAHPFGGINVAPSPAR